MRTLSFFVILSFFCICLNPFVSNAQDSTELRGANIIYQDNFPIDSTLEGRLFSIEIGKYVSSEVSSGSAIIGDTNAFNCILTRWMLSSNGLLPLASLLEYQRNPSTCLSSSIPGIVSSYPLEYSVIESGEIESRNHGRPQNPDIVINPDVFDSNLPQAWSQTVAGANGGEEIQWYYNRLGAEEEALYNNMLLPSKEDFLSLLEFSFDPLSDLPSWGYASINSPYMAGWDVENGYFWTSGSEFDEYYEGFAYNPMDDIKTKFYVEKGGNIALPLRLIR